MESYKEFMLKFFQYLAPNKSESVLRDDVEAVFKMEKQFAVLTLNETQRRNSTFKNMTLKDLLRELPDVRHAWIFFCVYVY